MLTMLASEAEALRLGVQPPTGVCTVLEAIEGGSEDVCGIAVIWEGPTCGELWYWGVWGVWGV